MPVSFLYPIAIMLFSAQRDMTRSNIRITGFLVRSARVGHGA
jgi:hypothetical protein